MTSTIVCQNLVPCFDNSQLIHPAETTATLKLTVTTTFDLSKTHNRDVRTNLDQFGNWGGLIQAKEFGDYHKDSCYTHPSWVTKSSFSRLTAKSLDLCTEHLGSETGTDDVVSDFSTVFRSSSLLSPPYNSVNITTTSFEEPQNMTTNHPTTRINPHRREAKSSRKRTDFPPPLTTMIGRNSLQMRRHREGGRLIIEAVETPYRNSYLQSERSNGRLTIRCFSPRPETTSSCTAADYEEEEECGGETAAAAEQEIEGAEIEVESGKEELIDGEMNNNVEKFQQRLSRCKEGRHCWKPDAALWVATS